MNLKIPNFITGTLSHDEVGEEVIKKIQKDYKGTVVDISTLKDSNEGSLRGSNPLYRFLVGKILNDFLKGQNISPHTLAQGEIALRNWNSHYDESPNTFWEDYGLVVFPKEGSHSNLWKYLRDQVQSEFKDSVDVDLPFAIEGIPSSLEIGNSHDSSKIDLGELIMVYNPPLLNKPGIHKFNSDDPGLIEEGFPKQLGQGDRNLFVGSSGVRRLCRGWCGDLLARYVYLDGSDDDGRVHYAKNFSIGNLSESLKELDEIALDHKQEIDKRANTMRKYMLTGKL